MKPDEGMKDRSAGTLVGQIAGDNLGALVEFRTRSEIASLYPSGVRCMADGGTWSLMAGQATDDSELALALARSLVRRGGYEEQDVLASYRRWYHSPPFDCGNTIAQALAGYPNGDSQANGALMRISPLGIYAAGARLSSEDMDRMAAIDARMTHPHRICVEINMLYIRAIALAVQQPLSGRELYERILAWAQQGDYDPLVTEWTSAAEREKPGDYGYQMGHVRIAWQNALYQLVHAAGVEEALADTIGEGGDTDTNAAICGALLGSVYGLSSMPSSWLKTLSACRPSSEEKRTRHPRAREYWPCDVLSLSGQLLDLGASFQR